MKEALKLMSYANRPFHTPVLQCDKIVRKNNQTVKVSLASRCALCGKDEEFLEHLLIHCPKVWCMWTAIFSLSGGGWVCPFMVKDLMLGWLRLPLRKKDAKLWRAVPLCLIWAIWKERNRVVFEDKAFSKTRLKSCLLFSLCS